MKFLRFHQLELFVVQVASNCIPRQSTYTEHTNAIHAQSDETSTGGFHDEQYIHTEGNTF